MLRGVCFCYEGIGKDGLAVAGEVGGEGGVGVAKSCCTRVLKKHWLFVTARVVSGVTY